MFSDVLYMCSGSVYYYTLAGSYWSLQSKIFANDGADGDWFGNSVTIYNSNALIGAYGDDDKANNAGMLKCLFDIQCIILLLTAISCIITIYCT
jgi:hypothetical protein